MYVKTFFAKILLGEVDEFASDSLYEKCNVNMKKAKFSRERE